MTNVGNFLCERRSLLDKRERKKRERCSVLTNESNEKRGGFSVAIINGNSAIDLQSDSSQAHCKTGGLGYKTQI